MPDLPEHTSASQLGMYARCPRQYRFKYIEGRLPERFSTNLALGSAVGSAVAWWFDAMREGRDATVDDAVRILRADLAAAVARPDVDWDDDTPETLAAQGEKLLRLFVERFGNLDVLRTEERVELPIVDPVTGAVLPRRLLGFLDFTLVDGSAVELKTAARAYSENDTARNLQFGAYRAVMRARGAGGLRLVVLVKTKTPKVQEVTLQADDRAVGWFMSAAADIERAIAAGLFPPAPGMSCAMCDFTAACAGSGVVEEVVREAAE